MKVKWQIVAGAWGLALGACSFFLGRNHCLPTVL